ncbi:D-alanine--D-alanyl carrier protein ligase [Streptomyces violaceorubidus]
MGAIYVAGDQVSLGYLGRPGLTAGRFVADPFRADGSRMYHTGDLARRTLHGELEFVGRADDQVQLKGFRIELGEVEAAIRDLDGVADAAVTVADSKDHLVAHVVGRVPADLTALLSAKLPAHMVPGRVLPVDALPLTVNGKLDRRALTERAALTPPTSNGAWDGGATDGGAPAHGNASASALASLVDIIAAALPGCAPDADTDFFAAGGDSIVAITVINRARALGLPMTPRDVFLLRTPRALAEHLGTRTPRSEASASARQEDGPLPPTPIILRRRELGGSLARFAQARTLTAPEGTGFADAERAARAVVATHPALRLRLRVDHGAWSLRTEPVGKVTVVRGTGTDAAGAADRAADRLDPENGDVVAFTWLEATRTLVVAVHHLAVDAVSWLILLDDLADAMRGADPAPQTTPYAEYARALTHRSGEETDGLAHWITTLQAPTPLPAAVNPRERTVVLAPGVSARVTRTAPVALGLGLTELLCGALRAALTRVQPTPTDLAVELERHGRVPALDGHDYTRTVGWFTAIAPVRLTAHTDPVAAAREVAERRPDERAHVAYGALRYLNPQTAPLLTARPQVLLNYLGRGGESDAPRLTDTDEGATPYAVEVNAWTDAATGSLHAAFTLAEGVPDEITGHWRRALERIAEAAATAERTAPVSPLQRGLYFQAQLTGPAGHYVAQSYFTFERRLDADALSRAMEHVLARHPAVGAGFTTDEDGNPVQVLAAGRRVGVRTVEAGTDADVDALRLGDRERGFDPGEPPLIRLTVVRLPDDRDGLLLSYHLLLWDGWSREIVLRDLFDMWPLPPHTGRHAAARPVTRRRTGRPASPPQCVGGADRWPRAPSRSGRRPGAVQGSGVAPLRAVGVPRAAVGVPRAAVGVPRAAVGVAACGGGSGGLAYGGPAVQVVGEGHRGPHALAHRLPVHLEALTDGHDDLQPVPADPAGVRGLGHGEHRRAVPHRDFHPVLGQFEIDQRGAGRVLAGVRQQLADHQLHHLHRAVGHRDPPGRAHARQERPGQFPAPGDVAGPALVLRRNLDRHVAQPIPRVGSPVHPIRPLPEP